MFIGAGFCSPLGFGRSGLEHQPSPYFGSAGCRRSASGVVVQHDAGYLAVGLGRRQAYPLAVVLLGVVAGSLMG